MLRSSDSADLLLATSAGFEPSQSNSIACMYENGLICSFDEKFMLSLESVSRYILEFESFFANELMESENGSLNEVTSYESTHH